MTKNVYYEPKGTTHYNVKFKEGALLNRVIAGDVCGIRPQDIEWIWIVEEMRNAMPGFANFAKRKRPGDRLEHW